MSRIVFWNVNNKDLTPYVCSLATTTNADVVVLNETGVTSDVIVGALRAQVSEEFYIPGTVSERRFQCFCRRPDLDMSEVHDGSRFSVRKFRVGSRMALLALIHGVDVRNYDPETRQSDAQSIADELRFVQQDKGESILAILGDFNMNPYDRSMNLAAGFNAMMTKSCVAPRTRRHVGRRYDFYYNPMWNLFGDNTPGPAGTVYDTSNQGPYGWSIFDQVVVHHSIVDAFESVEILTRTGDHSLSNNMGRPDSQSVSDHFPLLVIFRGDE